ncbi:MAG: ABC transporter ATP-binding protein [Thermoplasmatales archaeon]|nr:ABC transporter ATP-binding protein [Thermoplasmatales archaeon]
MTDIIVVEGLVKRFNGKAAVDGIDLTVKEGEIFGFLGPNGAGKTTTVRMITTLTDHDEGRIVVCGYDIDKNPTEAKEHMGMIQQSITLDRDLTVWENLTQHGRYHCMTKAERNARIEEIYDIFDLWSYSGYQINSLSGGWKKKVSIACALMHSPDILFLDEPTAGLDIQSRRLLWDLIKELHAHGKTVFLTTHYIEEAQALCDRVAFIDRGKIIANGTPAELIEGIGKFTVEFTDEKTRTQYRHFPHRDDAVAFMETLSSKDDILIRRTNLEDAFVELTGKTVGGA